MRRIRFRSAGWLLALSIAAALPAAHAQSVGSAFTYQGELRAAGSPANAAYDFQFRLFNSAGGTTQVGPTLTLAGVSLINGLFSVPLDFGPAQFAGDAQWLEISVRPATGGAFETLVPRTAVTPTPYALGAVAALANSVTGTSIVDGSVQAGDLAPGAVGTAQINPAQVQRRVTGSCSGSQGVQSIGQDGTVVCGIFGAGTINGVAAGTGLSGGGTSGSVTLSIAAGGVGSTQINPAQVQARVTGICAAGQYVQQVSEDGTVVCGTDATGAAGWSLTGNAGTNPSANFLGTTDSQPLVLRAGNVQALRLQPSAELSTANEPITANVVMGSYANQIVGNVRGSVIGGGGANAEGQDPGFTDATRNTVRSSYSVVGGGYANQIGLESDSSIGFLSVIDGGGLNSISSDLGVIGGGRSNQIGTSANASTIAGGFLNGVSGGNGTVGGGSLNRVLGPISTIAGGSDNEASGARATIAGGERNSAFDLAAVGGGTGNTANGGGSVIAGGVNNVVDGVAGVVAGGNNNGVAGLEAMVPGGASNCAGGTQSWAGGREAKVRVRLSSTPFGGGCFDIESSGDLDGDEGTFVWADSIGVPLVSTGPNRFLVRASGGFWFGNSGLAEVPEGRLINTSTGAHLTTGGTWTNASSRALKTAFEAIDAGDVLSRLLALPLTRWQYRGSPAEGVHLGPIAEDFHAAFGLGADGRAISTVDASGVALAAIQGLNAKLESERDALSERVERLDEENAALRARLEAIEARLGSPR